MRISDLSSDVFSSDRANAAVAAILQPGAVAATKRRNVLGPLIAILHHAARRQWRDHPNFELPTVAESSVTWTTPEQSLALERESADNLSPLTRFRVCCGERLGAHLGTDWRAVDRKSVWQGEDVEARVDFVGGR